MITEPTSTFIFVNLNLRKISLYRGTLLSTLVAIRYNEPIDTIKQMVDSGLPFGVLERSALAVLAESDPREEMKILKGRREMVKFGGRVSEETFKK